MGHPRGGAPSPTAARRLRADVTVLHTSRHADTDQCEQALAFAFEEAALRKARLTAMHAVHRSFPTIRLTAAPTPVERA